MTPDSPAHVLQDEHGVQYVVLDRRTRKKLGPFTTWQWAVVSAWFVLALVGTVLTLYTVRTFNNTKRLNESICAQAVYLDGIKAKSPAAQKATDDLEKKLRKLQRCPQATREVPAPPG